MSTLTLAEFLLARIAEEKAAALAATPGPWWVDSDLYPEAIHALDGATPVGGSRWGGEASVFESTDDALHIARWNPARVLADCEVRRQIVELHTTDGPHDWANGYEEACVDVLRLLASPYVAHQDFREEFRP